MACSSKRVKRTTAIIAKFSITCREAKTQILYGIPLFYARGFLNICLRFLINLHAKFYLSILWFKHIVRILLLEVLSKMSYHKTAPCHTWNHPRLVYIQSNNNLHNANNKTKRNIVRQ